jgi:hypothetical protein
MFRGAAAVCVALHGSDSDRMISMFRIRLVTFWPCDCGACVMPPAKFRPFCQRLVRRLVAAPVRHFFEAAMAGLLKRGREECFCFLPGCPDCRGAAAAGSAVADLGSAAGSSASRASSAAADLLCGCFLDDCPSSLPQWMGCVRAYRRI